MLGESSLLLSYTYQPLIPILLEWGWGEGWGIIKLANGLKKWFSV